MKRTLFFIGMLLVVTAMLAGPSRAALFSCDNAGLDAAIASSEAGDSGPHSLNCSPGDIIPVDRAPGEPPRPPLSADLTLDGRSATIECGSPMGRCDPVFRITSPVACGLPTCSPPVFGPPPTVELRDLTLLGGASALAEMPRSLSGTSWHRDSADDNRLKILELPVHAFIRRFLLHVLPKGFVRIRHYGLLANRSRRQRIASCRELLAAQAPAPPPASENLFEKVLRLTGHDLSLCPACGEGRMAVVAELDKRGGPTARIAILDSS